MSFLNSKSFANAQKNIRLLEGIEIQLSFQPFLHRICDFSELSRIQQAFENGLKGIASDLSQETKSFQEDEHLLESYPIQRIHSDLLRMQESPDVRETLWKLESSLRNRADKIIRRIIETKNIQAKDRFVSLFLTCFPEKVGAQKAAELKSSFEAVSNYRLDQRLLQAFLVENKSSRDNFEKVLQVEQNVLIQRQIALEEIRTILRIARLYQASKKQLGEIMKLVVVSTLGMLFVLFWKNLKWN
jgi:hypothetical protein